MKRQPVSLALIVVYGITTILWIVLCVRDLLGSGQVDGLRIFCAVVWIIGFFALLGRYRKER